MLCAELWILDQTRAWTVFRDHNSVDLVKPGQGASGLTFRQLWGIRARGYKESTPIRPKIKNSDELDRACAAGELRALRLFRNGTTERIPAREWRDGTPKNPQQIRFLPGEVMAIFPAPDDVPASQDAVEYNRPPESTIPDSDLSLPPSSTPSASAFTAKSIPSGTVAERRPSAVRYSPEWITPLEAIGHLQRVVNEPGEAIETVRFPLREGKIRSRYWGTDRPIEPLAWYRATIFSDGTVEFHTGDALYEGRLKPIGLGRRGDRVEVHRDDLLRCFPEQGQKRQRGPKPGTVDRYGESDRALFADIEDIMKREKASVEAAAKKLAHADKIAGTGSHDSLASRLAKRYRRERAKIASNSLRNSS